MSVETSYKKCTKCKQDLMTSEFLKHKNSKNKLMSYCKICRNKYRNELYYSKKKLLILMTLESQKINNEEWRNCVEFNDDYQVSNIGRVRNKKARLVTIQFDKDGYCVVKLFHKGNKPKRFVHRLVAEAFIPNLENKKTVDHIDRNKTNNNVDNLRWATHSEQNMNQGKRINFPKIETNSEDLKDEIWKSIDGYDNYYISNYGRLKHFTGKNNNFRIIVAKNNIIEEKTPETEKNNEENNAENKKKNNYVVYSLYNLKNKKSTTHYAHRLVAQAFIFNPNNLPQVNHKNGNKSDNHLENLEWVTEAENSRHAVLTGLNKCKKKIYQVDENKNIIKKWDSITDAANSLNTAFANISQALRSNNNRSCGYLWFHEKDYDLMIKN